MFLNISQAAKLAGVTRNTVYRALKSGRMSQTAHGIDVAELERVFGPLPPINPAQGATLPPAPQEQRADAPAEQIGMLRDQLDFMRQQLTAAQERERRLLDLLERQSRLLTHPGGPEPAEARKEEAGGWFGWLNRK